MENIKKRISADEFLIENIEDIIAKKNTINTINDFLFKYGEVHPRRQPKGFYQIQKPGEKILKIN